MRAPLTMTVFLAFSSLGLDCQPATPSPGPSFEVASIKVARNPGTLSICPVPCANERLTVNGARVDIRYMSLYHLIVRAYRVKPYQLSGPNWMTSQKFDIVAKMPNGASKDQIPEMLRTLLAERFGLSIHRESKELSVYALVVGKNGPKKAVAGKAVAAVPEIPGGQTQYTPYGEAYRGENGVWRIKEGPYGPIRMKISPVEQNLTTRLEFLRITMPGLAEALTPSVDRVVADATGLPGNYEVAVEWTVPPPPPPSPGGGSGPLPAPQPSLSFQSITRAGLKLEKRKAPVDVIVVDSLEKTPAAN